jgi:hypothetical protein
MKLSLFDEDFIIGKFLYKSKKDKVVIFFLIKKFIELITKIVDLIPVKLQGQFTTTKFSKLFIVKKFFFKISSIKGINFEDSFLLKFVFILSIIFFSSLNKIIIQFEEIVFMKIFIFYNFIIILKTFIYS